MKKQTANMMRYFFRGALLLALVFLVIRVMPGAFAQRNNQISKAEVTRAAIIKESANADVPLTKKRTFVPAEPAACNLDGTLGAAPAGGSTGTLTTRLLRAGVTTSCASAPFPGNSSSGPFIYNEHQITNNVAGPLCTNVTLHYVSGGTATVNLQVAAFMAPFTAADILSAARYLGDPGASSGNPPADTTFAVNIPGGGNNFAGCFLRKRFPCRLGCGLPANTGSGRFLRSSSSCHRGRGFQPYN